METLSKMIIILLFSLLMSSHIISAASPPKPNESSLGLDRQRDDGQDSSQSWFRNYWRQQQKKDKDPYRNVGRMTCDRYPRVCHVSGSPGPDCCKKKCVNVRNDSLNCGMCGKKCRYPEVCCKGKCVNPLRDRKNCGRCGNKCQRGSFCSFGMCSYA